MRSKRFFLLSFEGTLSKLDRGKHDNSELSVLNRIYLKKKKLVCSCNFKIVFYGSGFCPDPNSRGKKAEPDPNKRTWIRNTGVNDTAELPGMTLVKLKNHREIS